MAELVSPTVNFHSSGDQGLVVGDQARNELASQLKIKEQVLVEKFAAHVRLGCGCSASASPGLM